MQKNHSLRKLKLEISKMAASSKVNKVFNLQEKGVLSAVTPDPWNIVYREYFIFEFTYVVKTDLFSFNCYFHLYTSTSLQQEHGISAPRIFSHSLI